MPINIDRKEDGKLFLACKNEHGTLNRMVYFVHFSSKRSTSSHEPYKIALRPTSNKDST